MELRFGTVLEASLAGREPRVLVTLPCLEDEVELSEGGAGACGVGPVGGLEGFGW